MSRKLTKGGFAVAALGAVLAVVGFVFFFSVFFSAARQMNQPFGPPSFGSPFGMYSSRPVPFQNAVIGVIFVGIGALLVKAGLGMSLVGSSNDIASWIRGLIHGEANLVTCPNCQRAVSSTAQFCSHCGTRLT